MNPAMPFVFIYDKVHRLEQIIQVGFPGLEKIESNVSSSESLASSGAYDSDQPAIINPPPVGIKTDKRISMNNYIIDVQISENRVFIYYANRFADLRFLTVLKKKASGWEPAGSYRFIKNNGNLFTVFSMTYDDGWLYLASMFEQDIIRMKVE
jgi:hypothetical protein